MTTSNPMRGLLTLTYFKTRGKILGVCAYSAIFGIVFVLSDIEFIQMFFFMSCSVYLPLQAIAGMAENEGRWERFQVSLPIKRGFLLKAQYLSLVFTSVLGGVILTAGIGASTIISDEWFNYGFASAILSNVHLFGMAFLAIGLCFLLSLVVGNFIAWIVGGLVPALTQVLIPIIADNLDISVYILSSAVLAGSVAVFVISYFVMKMAMEKADF